MRLRSALHARARAPASIRATPERRHGLDVVPAGANARVDKGCQGTLLMPCADGTHVRSPAFRSRLRPHSRRGRLARLRQRMTQEQVEMEESQTSQNSGKVRSSAAAMLGSQKFLANSEVRTAVRFTNVRRKPMARV